jgi:ParB-like nuclease family protein
VSEQQIDNEHNQQNPADTDTAAITPSAIAKTAPEEEKQNDNNQDQVHPFPPLGFRNPFWRDCPTTPYRIISSRSIALSDLSKPAFWNFLDNRGWCHPYVDRVKRVEFDQIPRFIANLSGDPFRSLFGETRRFRKGCDPFSEFIRAAFLLVERDFEAAIAEALGLPRLVRARRELVSV